MTTKEHIDHLLKLNKVERISVVQLLWDSIASEGDEKEVAQAEKEMLDDRQQQYDAGSLHGDSWENIQKRLLAEWWLQVCADPCICRWWLLGLKYVIDQNISEKI